MTDPTAEAWPGTASRRRRGGSRPRRARTPAGRLGLEVLRPGRRGLRATLGSSTITLGGLLKHLAHVEDCHFARLWLGSPVGAPWDAVDGCSAPDRDHRSAAEDTPEALHTLWRGAVARSRAVVDEALGAGGLDQLGACATRSGERPDLRRVLLDLVEEYARHAGHADLIRASVDGLTGEDPPR
ncbi:mycothiol transferase [Streptomyces virginiae]|uniref:mycothiol transferase n=1 Tax=Streptomyces virginiae TaxID=1961 RepID=UPI002250F4E8|nr:DUF664 domain-containing protein [Streptomyces virginiae]MCX5275491.1 DinB family protein [Streptomyces virginiae]